MPVISWKHFHTLASWRRVFKPDRPSPEICPYMVRRRKAAWVSFTDGMRWKSTSCCLVFLPSRTPCGDGNTEDLHPLLRSWQQRIASPHDCVWFHNSGYSGHLLHSAGFNATSVPDLGLAMVHVDVGVIGQLFSHRCMNIVQPLRSTRGVNIILC